MIWRLLRKDIHLLAASDSVAPFRVCVGHSRLSIICIMKPTMYEAFRGRRGSNKHMMLFLTLTEQLCFQNRRSFANKIISQVSAREKQDEDDEGEDDIVFHCESCEKRNDSRYMRSVCLVASQHQVQSGIHLFCNQTSYWELSIKLNATHLRGNAAKKNFVGTTSMKNWSDDVAAAGLSLGLLLLTR